LDFLWAFFRSGGETGGLWNLIFGRFLGFVGFFVEDLVWEVEVALRFRLEALERPAKEYLFEDGLEFRLVSPESRRIG
jgi:hypothetical protein